jgi:hypothetical protein
LQDQRDFSTSSASIRYDQHGLSRAVALKSLKLLKQTFEIRYESGYRYLDKTGETMLILEKLLPDLTGKVWMPIEVVPAGAKLKCPELDLMLHLRFSEDDRG